MEIVFYMAGEPIDHIMETQKTGNEKLPVYRDNIAYLKEQMGKAHGILAKGAISRMECSNRDKELLRQEIIKRANEN